MTQKIKNKAASVQARLKKIAIAEHREFNAIVLRETFVRRDTPFDKTPAVFTKEFIDDESRLTMWNNFIDKVLNNQKLPGLQFNEVLDVIERFLKPI